MVDRWWHDREQKWWGQPLVFLFLALPLALVVMLYVLVLYAGGLAAIGWRLLRWWYRP